VTSSAAVLRFSAEFATFLVVVVGAAIVALRPGLLGVGRQSRATLTLGFLALGTAAFLHGSLLYEARDLPVILTRSLGIVLVAVGTLGWGADRAIRRVVWAALVLMTLAEASAATGTASAVADAARIVAAAGLGAVLVSSARRSIPARVAVSTAAMLLVVVLAVSVALSVVISDNVQKEALRRADTRARAEASETDSAVRPATARSANLVASVLQSSLGGVLAALSQQPGPNPDVDRALQNFATSDLLDSRSPYLYATDSRALVVAHGIDLPAAEALVGSEAVDQALGPDRKGFTVTVAGNRALAVAAQAVLVGDPANPRTAGVFVATSALDDVYLKGRVGSDPTVSLAVVDRTARLAGSGGHLPPAGVLRVARAALASPAGKASSVVSGAFLAAQAVRTPAGARAFALVASTPTTAVDNTRSSLFRTLFIVALVTALAAFLAALYLGERIGVGLRRLTVVADSVRRGDFTTRVGTTSPDELGVLGSTLDTMAGSIETLTTELRQNRDEEAQLRGRLEAVVGGMGEAVVAVDEQGRVTTFNGAAEELFGVAAARAEGRPVAEVVRVTTEEGADLTSRLARPQAGGWVEAAAVHRADGVDVPVALSAGSLRGAGGGVNGGVWVLRDMRREREAERTKADLLANISHELRTPLVPIKGYAMMLRRGRLDRERTEEALGTISEAADQLERVVGRLLEVASSGAAADPVTMAPTEVGPLVNSVVQRWKTREHGRHPITRRVSRNLPVVAADRRRLEESLDELIDNAVKFSPEGSRILVSARLADNGVDNGHAPAVEISVDDLGVGIAAEELDRIFEDFAQGDSSATRSFGGLGLGLSVVRRTVQAHEGELVCETEEGKGSRFSMILPVERDA
jgi:two-component system phosphate regulon sensor histidine kinase PhoR